jgi:hypothetical protein
MNKTERRNFVLQILNGLFVILGDTLADARVVTTVFLSQLTTSNLLIGLIAPLRDAGWFLPQLFVAPWVERSPRKVDFYRTASIFRAFGWVALAASVFVFRGNTLLIAFTLATLVVSLISGVTGLPWMIIITKTIAPTRRGMLFALRNSSAAVLGIIGSIAVAWILSGALG